VAARRRPFPFFFFLLLRVNLFSSLSLPFLPAYAERETAMRKKKGNWAVSIPFFFLFFPESGLPLSSTPSLPAGSDGQRNGRPRGEPFSSFHSFFFSGPPPPLSPPSLACGGKWTRRRVSPFFFTVFPFLPRAPRRFGLGAGDRLRTALSAVSLLPFFSFPAFFLRFFRCQGEPEGHRIVISPFSPPFLPAFSFFFSFP